NAEALTHASGRVATTTLVWHYRISPGAPATGSWPNAARRLEDARGALPSLLHAYCTPTAALPPSRAAPPPARWPAPSGGGAGRATPPIGRRTSSLTTPWKQTGRRLRERAGSAREGAREGARAGERAGGGVVLLVLVLVARARGLEPLPEPLP